MEVMEVIKYCGTINRNGENRNKKNSSGVKRMNLLWRLFSLIMSLSLILKHLPTNNSEVTGGREINHTEWRCCPGLPCQSWSVRVLFKLLWPTLGAPPSESRCRAFYTEPPISSSHYEFLLSLSTTFGADNLFFFFFFMLLPSFFLMLFFFF